VRLVIAACACAAALTFAATASAKVLHVGTFHGKKGFYKTINAALSHANSGDWVLVGPGDYKEKATTVPVGANGAGAAVLIEKPGVHVRGMNRNGVVLDGTLPKTPKCSPNPADQNYGPLDESGHATGRNGLEVWKAEGVSVENLTACNFLTGSGGGGNEIWVNDGDGSGKHLAGPWRGAYLSATSTFYESKDKPHAEYGIFSSNSDGPGLYTQVYANDMADAAFYIGACPDCNTILDHAHGQHSDLGVSSTNASGHFTVQNSEFDDNQSGYVTNSQNNDDAPSPQDGACPKAGEKGPTGSHNCWVLTKNLVHDNNNPNVPTSGSAEAGPVGSGIVIAGGHNDIVNENKVYNNGAWGILLVPYPDTETPPPIAHCEGGVEEEIEGKHVCYYDDFGNEVTNNTLEHNGFFGNPSDVDLGEISNPEKPGNCWHGSKDPGQLMEEPTSEPKAIQQFPHSMCGIPDSGEALASPLGQEVACDSQLLAEITKGVECAGKTYPRQTKVVLQALPKQTPMPNPCAGVPKNSWCSLNKEVEPPYPVPGEPAE
jgi:hypothetical protein